MAGENEIDDAILQLADSIRDEADRKAELNSRLAILDEVQRELKFFSTMLYASFTMLQGLESSMRNLFALLGVEYQSDKADLGTLRNQVQELLKENMASQINVTASRDVEFDMKVGKSEGGTDDDEADQR